VKRIVCSAEDKVDGLCRGVDNPDGLCLHLNRVTVCIFCASKN